METHFSTLNSINTSIYMLIKGRDYLFMLALMSYHFWVMVALCAALSLSYSIKESSVDNAYITKKLK